MIKISKFIIMFFIVASLAVSPLTGVQAQGTSANPLLHSTAVVTPTTITPAGTITDTTPTFTWSKISGATRYQYYLYKGASTQVYLQTVSATVCGTSTCVHTPTKVLGYASNYQWKIRAMVGGVWKAVSAKKVFNIVTASSVTPVPKTPSGAITDDTPTYTWSKITVATQYQYTVYKGTTVMYSYTILSSACGTSTCSGTPTAKYLANGTYTWKVRTLVGGTWQAFSAAKSFTLSASSTVPTALRPSATTYGSSPSFQWSKTTGATSYQYFLYANGTSVYARVVAASACGSLSYCSYTPTEVLSAGTVYTWNVRAYVGNIWRATSSTKTFNIVLTASAFSSNFNSDALGWTPSWGTWQLNGAAYYSTPGVKDTFASIKHDGAYATMTYEARMKRLGTCTECGSYLIIRGVESPLNSEKAWYNSLLFEYSNNGYFLILQTNNGSPSRFVDWTESSAIVPNNNWNVLKVVANYNFMRFYINNTLVWSGTISTAEPVGQVGIGMFSKGLSGDNLDVDYATLTTTAAAASSTDIEAESSYAPMQEVTETNQASNFGVSP